MDSAWFAVDACGHVAAASTGEAGALPGPFRPQEIDRLALQEAIARVAPPGDVVLDLAAQSLGDVVGPHRLWGDQPRDALVFVDRLEDLSALLASHHGRVVPAVAGVAAVLPAVTPAVLSRLHADGRCRACSWVWTPFDRDRPAALGLFEYQHLCENWIAGPYGLVRPRHPLKLGQLPPEVASVAEWVVFEGLCFADHPLLQPADHVPCATWGAPYLSADGRTVRTQRLEGLDPDDLDDVVGRFVVDPGPWRPLRERGSP